MPEEKQSAPFDLGKLGVLFVSGPIDQGVSQSLCERIVDLNVCREVDCIQMLINSAGGEWHAGFAVVDMMAWSRLPVYTTGLGLVASMALVLFMAGSRGNRVLMPHTSLISHSFRSSGEGTHHEMVARRRQEDWMHDRLVRHYLRHTALKAEEEVSSRLLREVDTFLTPGEALDLGIADRIQQQDVPATLHEWREMA